MRFPGKCKEKDSVYYTSENEIPRSVGVFPGFYCPPTQIFPASAIARSSCLAAEAELPGNVIAKEEFYRRQDHRCSFKSDPWSVVHPGEANHPRRNTKLLLSASWKAYPAVNLKIKKLNENKNLRKNKPPPEHQGHLIFKLKSYAAIQNLMRLYL